MVAVHSRDRSVLAAFIAAGIPSVALASAAAHGESGTTPGQWLMLGCTFANFLLFFFLIRHYARVPLRDFLQERRKRTVEAMAEAARAKQEAESLKREYEARLAGLEDAKRALLAEVRAMVEADRQRTLSAAKETAERLQRDADLTARSDLERARRELRAEAARLAGELATARLREGLAQEQYAGLLAEFLEHVESTR